MNDEFDYDEIAERVKKKIGKSVKVKSALTNAQRQMLGEQLGGITPMQLLMSIARDEDEDIGARVEAAKILMPYVHKKMPIATEVLNPVLGVVNLSRNDLKGISDAEIDAAINILDRVGVRLSPAERQLGDPDNVAEDDDDDD